MATHAGTASGRHPSRARRARVNSRSKRGLDGGLSLRLPGNPDACAQARRALRNLHGDIDPPLMETLRLLVTELVTNSVRHARADTVLLRVLVGRRTVRTEVVDGGSGFDPGEAGGSNDRPGWGLFLVERLAHRWGVSRDGDGTKVWFELRRG
jgi:anti-sigma regulatory factor (Ser/Thr protein kinase)